jgi:hypothetical protein
LPDYTPYQKGIIRRYYEHGETLALQNLSEIVSDLYLADTAAAKERLWKRAAAALAKLKSSKARTERIVAERDLEGLAALLTDLTRQG